MRDEATRAASILLVLSPLQPTPVLPFIA